MNVTSVRSQTSIVAFVLLGVDSTLQSAMVGLDVLSLLFSRIELMATANDDVADLARIGGRAAHDGLADCRDHASANDVIGAADCLTCAVSAHSAAKNLLLGIAALGDINVAELAQLGVNLSVSVLNDLGCDNAG